MVILAVVVDFATGNEGSRKIITRLVLVHVHVHTRPFVGIQYHQMGDFVSACRIHRKPAIRLSFFLRERAIDHLHHVTSTGVPVATRDKYIPTPLIFFFVHTNT